MSQRYTKDGEFTDPVVRCCECSKIITRQAITAQGGCPYCGNRRVRNVLNLTGEEMTELKGKGIDDEFLGLFEAVANAG